MTKITITVLMLLSINFLNAQEEKLKAYFKENSHILTTGSNKEVSHVVEVVVPAQPKYEGTQIQVHVENNLISPPLSEIFLTEDNNFKVSRTEEISKKISVKFSRNLKDDRLIILKIRAFDKVGDTLTLEEINTEYKIYIKPLSNDISENEEHGYQLWFHTGTNFDFLDGIKAEDLYFKGSYLLNIPKEKERTPSWIYATFGKNRYSTERDSIPEILFNMRILNPTPSDSIEVINGYYNTLRKATSESIFASLKYLYNVERWSNKNSRLFLSIGFYWDLQVITRSYSNQVIASDTTKYYINEAPIRFEPLARENKIRQMNYNLGAGYLHILSTDIVDVKTQLTVGYNILTYPERVIERGLTRREFSRREAGYFIMFSTEATVLNPGISIGFETFMRKDNYPLFNVYLTKVLTLEKLAALFSPISSLETN